MNSEVREILTSLKEGAISVEEAAQKLKLQPFEDLGFAKIDHHRALRQGVAEVIYGAGKTPEQIVGIIDTMQKNGQDRILITRMSPEAAEYVGNRY